MRIARLALCVTTAMILSVAPLQSRGRGHGSSHAITSHGGPHAAAATHGNPHASAPTMTPHEGPHASPHRGNHATAAQAHGSQKKTATGASASSGSSPSTGGSSRGGIRPGGTGASTRTTLNPIAQKISAHPKLAAKLKTLVPMGMTLNDASAGFENEGQFIAALHVSQNLNIPFADLKAAMLGTPKPVSAPTPSTPGAAGTTRTTGTSTTTSNSPMSLGEAIEKLRPSADASDEVVQAQRETELDLLSGTRSGGSTRRSPTSGSGSSTSTTGSSTGTTPATSPTTKNSRHGK